MSEKPILFNTAMVQAILSGDKTCTRRVIKDVSGLNYIGYVECSTNKKDEGKVCFGVGSFEDITNLEIEKYIRPPYHIGDILYVRETWKKYQKRVGSGNNCCVAGFYGYKADEDNPNNPSEFYEAKWKPSIHMPKEAARIFLRVTDVRVERLQDITDEECYKEGIGDTDFYNQAEHTQIAGIGLSDSLERAAFALLWNSTLSRRDWFTVGWNNNPWVWVIEFEKVNNYGKTGK